MSGFHFIRDTLYVFSVLRIFFFIVLIRSRSPMKQSNEFERNGKPRESRKGLLNGHTSEQNGATDHAAVDDKMTAL